MIFLNKVLILLLTCMMAIDVDPIHLAQHPRQKTEILQALKSLKDLIPSIAFLKAYDDGVFFFMSTPGYINKVNENFVSKFLSIPIILSKLNNGEAYYNKVTINSIFKTLEKSRNEFMAREGLSSFTKTYEYLIFENLDKAQNYIKQLQCDMERIKLQTDLDVKTRAVNVSLLTALNLQNSLFHIRCAHLMDFSTFSSNRYDVNVKTLFIDQTYSQAIEELQALKSLV